VSETGVINTPDQRLRVFVSSTLGELAPERRAVRDAVTSLRLVPVMFELGARPHPPRDLYRAYLAQSQVFIGIYWQSYGWVAPGEQISGLEDEYQLATGLPQLLYVKGPAPDREPRLAEMLGRIRNDGGLSYQHFTDAAELQRLVENDLAVLLSERFAVAAAGQAAVAAGQDAAAARARAGAHGLRPLPVSTTSLLGREQDLDEVTRLIERPDVRLVTLTGPGGVGKTRLAVALGERLRDRYTAGTVYVPLDMVTDPDSVLTAIGRAAGADLTGTHSPLEALAETFGDGAWLLILDNLEQVVQVARELGELPARCPRLAILATSRTVLRLRAEREYPLRPLPVPADPGYVPLEGLRSSPAVALFVDRARAVRPDFALTEDNGAAVAEICRRLEGLPLAIELAAARTRLLEPDVLLDRLARSLDALGTGAVDLPERQRTLRATVEWSVGLLTAQERSLLEITAVFVDGWTIPAAAQVAAVDEEQALELSEQLAGHSLIYSDSSQFGSRTRMLETVREFVSEQLAARADAGQIGQRHADYYRALAEQADRPLRSAGRGEWLERLDADAGNLAAAVRWYLAQDPGPLPHLFRILWLFWSLRDHEREARSWVEQLLPTAGTLDLQSQVELMWAAAVTAVDTGNDSAALVARQYLAPLLDEIHDPFLHAASRLAMAWTLPIPGDFDGTLREAALALEEFRGQDEPIFSAMAGFTAGSVEIALGRYDEAMRHLSEARDQADRAGDWLAAGARAQLGILAVLRGRLDEAPALLAGALEVSLAARSTQFVAMCLVGYAWLAFAEGDLDRAARVEGSADGLRQRIGLPAWPHLRKKEAELVAQIRQRLGASQFDQAFSAGSQLTLQQAVAIVQDQQPDVARADGRG
jgi:predicted ATPase